MPDFAVADSVQAVLDFLHTGGIVLWVLLFVTLAMWAAIIERALFFRLDLPQLQQAIVERWNARSDRSSWFAEQVRQALISQGGQAIAKNIDTIKVFVLLCPLLGLLGTVTGMITVFDVMAITGTGNARLMASGISMATLPTLAGMVASLSGLYFGTLFSKKAESAQQQLDEALQLTFK